MKRMNHWLVTAAISVTLGAATSSAISLSEPGPAHPQPGQGMTPVSLPVAENLTAGSAALVPLMAADVATPVASTIDASAPAGGGDIGKPIDDISFLARAAENARKEQNAARDALPQLSDPELKRLAEALIKDHADAHARMTKIAGDKMWPLPASQRNESPPAGTASADFDANWTDDMILAHERAVQLYSAQAHGGEDPDLRRYARETLPTFQHHLAELRRLQK